MTCVISDLLKDWPCSWIQGSFSHPVWGITDDSRKVQNGVVFVAIKGKNENGNDYIDDAVNRGAVCIVTDEKLSATSVDKDIAYAVVPNTKTFLSHASSRVYGNPSHHMHIIAVTGTNGKTTVSHLIGQLLRAQGVNVAVIGTVGLFINNKKIDSINSNLTTWNAPELHHTLSYCLKQNVTHVVLEASSMGLAQHRLDHVKINQGVLLNLGHDHLEDHSGLREYQKAKCRLIPLSDNIVANEDDDFWFYHAQKCRQPVEWFNKHQVSILAMNSNSMALDVEGALKPIEVPFTGVYNASNLGAALATLKQIGYSRTNIIPSIASLSLPEGRFQLIEKEHCQVLIDYAHTPEALEQLLDSASRIAQGKLILVFGCGGDRDKEKRADMGKIAAHYAHEIWVTSDNPRSENPLTICNEVISDLPNLTNIHVEVNRKRAIESALSQAKYNDIVLIAGKGHETTQQIGAVYHPFSDKKTVKDYLSRLASFNGNNKE